MDHLLDLIYWVGDLVRKIFSKSGSQKEEDYFYWSNLVIGIVVIILAVMLSLLLFRIYY